MGLNNVFYGAVYSIQWMSKHVKPCKTDCQYTCACVCFTDIKNNLNRWIKCLWNCHTVKSQKTTIYRTPGLQTSSHNPTGQWSCFGRIFQFGISARVGIKPNQISQEEDDDQMRTISSMSLLVPRQNCASLTTSQFLLFCSVFRPGLASAI